MQLLDKLRSCELPARNRWGSHNNHKEETMTVRYNLSRKQIESIRRKEPVRLAVPILADYNQIDEEAVRKAAIDALGLNGVSGVEVIPDVTVNCALLNRGGGPDSISTYMGEIVDIQRLGNLPCYQIQVLVVCVNGGRTATRWPAGPVEWE